MSSSRNLQDTVNWCEPFLSGKPLYLGAGSEPVLTNANIVKQTILAPPFRWAWNRAESAPFASAVGVSDNAVALSTFGFIERAYLVLAGQPTFEIPNIVECLGPANAQEKDRPLSIAAQLDDNAGNITFRVAPAYDQIYQVTIVHQQKAALMTSLASSWSPIPDEFSNIYNMGVLALSLMFDDDPRFQIVNSRFVASLLSRAEGLSETQRSIFAARWNMMLSQPEAGSMRVKQGVNASGQI